MSKIEPEIGVLTVKLNESNKLIIKKNVEKSLEKLKYFEYIKEDLDVKLEETNKLVDGVKSKKLRISPLGLRLSFWKKNLLNLIPNWKKYLIPRLM